MHELRIASIGNVDSAKSTTISCIANNIIDNGRGSARSKILKHKHEGDTGRTSSITQYYINNNDKVIGFIDLAGHEKYLKTTMSGLTGSMIDYGMMTIGGERGIIGMTKEHLSMAIGLNIPLFFIITKIDIAPQDKIDNILEKIAKIMATNAGGNKKTIIIRDSDNISELDDWTNNKICPIFLTSNKTGYNLTNLRNFIYSLKSRETWINPAIDYNEDINKILRIDDVFNVKGVGIVISGLVKQGTISVDDKLFVGPFNGQYKRILVKSIHDNFRTSVKTLGIGKSGCLNIRFLDNKNIGRKDILRGMIVILKHKAIWEFEAKVLIIKNTTTIRKNYEPIIHCGTVRQSAKICSMNKEILRSGDTAIIHFRFLFHSEYIEVGTQLIFREGNTKGIGKITKIIA